MTTLTTYTFGNSEIRVLQDEKGEPLFVATDLAKPLGYRTALDMTRMLDEDEIGGTRQVRTPSKNQHGEFDFNVEVSVINESGLYHAIFNSQKPEAKSFRKWVTSEVLPSIRKTGSYVLESRIKELEFALERRPDILSKTLAIKRVEKAVEVERAKTHRAELKEDKRVKARNRDIETLQIEICKKDAHITYLENKIDELCEVGLTIEAALNGTNHLFNIVRRHLGEDNPDFSAFHR